MADQSCPKVSKEALTFTANLAARQSAIMLSGSGERCLLELEAFGLDAVIAFVGMAKFAGRSFQITVTEVQSERDKSRNPENKPKF